MSLYSYDKLEDLKRRPNNIFLSSSIFDHFQSPSEKLDLNYKKNRDKKNPLIKISSVNKKFDHLRGVRDKRPFFLVSVFLWHFIYVAVVLMESSVFVYFDANYISIICLRVIVNQ